MKITINQSEIKEAIMEYLAEKIKVSYDCLVDVFLIWSDEDPDEDGATGIITAEVELLD